MTHKHLYDSKWLSFYCTNPGQFACNGTLRLGFFPRCISQNFALTQTDSYAFSNAKVTWMTGSAHCWSVDGCLFIEYAFVKTTKSKFGNRYFINQSSGILSFFYKEWIKGIMTQPEIIRKHIIFFISQLPACSQTGLRLFVMSMRSAFTVCSLVNDRRRKCQNAIFFTLPYKAVFVH